MPRKNRIRSEDEPPPLRIGGGPRTVVGGGRAWHGQPRAGAQARKGYPCPGCGGVVEPGTAHVVAWRADGVLGDRADLEARRHWHLHCWRAA